MSSEFSQHQADANLGRHHLHAELDHTKLGQQNVLVGQTGLASTVQTDFASSVQTTALISNDPKSVISQDQRIAANMPIITEKHVTQEYVPVIHEEIVTTIPVVTGQSVHTGQAIAGQSFVQQMGSQYIQQQALTKVDLIPEVQTQLSAQRVVNISTQSQPHLIGKANVLTSQQLNQQQLTQQQHISQPVVTTTQTTETQYIQQPTLVQNQQAFAHQQQFNQQGFQQGFQPGFQQGFQQGLISQPTAGIPLTQSIPMNQQLGANLSQNLNQNLNQRKF